MVAPALILWTPGSDNTAATEGAHALRWALQAKRPGIDVHLAFTDVCPPTASQVTNTLARRGTNEMVFVPLSAIWQQTENAALTQVRRSHANLSISVSRPVGPDVGLLPILDDRMRTALRQANSPVDALILATAPQTDVRGKELVARRARQWAAHHRLPCMVASGASNGALETAISHLRSRGRRHIAVGSLHLCGDDEFLAAQAIARRRGVVISDPIGPDDRLVDVVLSRYCVTAMRMVALDHPSAIAV